ncbi:protein disulfide oxidoreductase, partial [Pseudomonas aeruginosa]|nr:protein disulfide oxidoreductase [Pseudomonas aeruginosa]
LAADGGNVLTVALRSGDSATLEKWLTRKKMALPTVNDPSGQLARQWDIQVTPTLVVISQGEVKSVTTGWTSGWGMRLRLWLASW